MFPVIHNHAKTIMMLAFFEVYLRMMVNGSYALMKLLKCKLEQVFVDYSVLHFYFQVSTILIDSGKHFDTQYVMTCHTNYET